MSLLMSGYTQRAAAASACAIPNRSEVVLERATGGGGAGSRGTWKRLWVRFSAAGSDGSDLTAVGRRNVERGVRVCVEERDRRAL